MIRTALGARAGKSGRRTTVPSQDKGKASAQGKRSTPSKDRAKVFRSRSKKPARGARTAPAKEQRRSLPLLVRLLVMLLAFVAMVGFAVALARLTLEPSPASKALIHTNLHPGRSLRAYLDQPALRDAVKQIGGNILLGVPFGVLLPVLVPRTRGILRVVLLTAAVMLLVELAQGAFITGRAFDIDDVILNTTGALVGYLLLGRRMGRAVHPRRRFRNRRDSREA
ncbi:VanZ family protein [Streptomyces sp. NPDC059466]|uniref:VanZ family protein n=1 Tax=unclassified Streptomyces TaxID=2593676 RepID=UPI0036926B1E